jgi:hypothetical protein
VQDEAVSVGKVDMLLAYGESGRWPLPQSGEHRLHVRVAQQGQRTEIQERGH